MRFLKKIEDIFQLELTNAEVFALSVSLRRARVHPPTQGEPYILPRIQASTCEVDDLVQRLKVTDFSEGSCQNNADSNHCFSFEFTSRQILIIVQAIDELANGFSLLDGEFDSIIGVTRGRMREHLTDFHKLLANKGKFLEALKYKEQ
jgi:hypothetical protein